MGHIRERPSREDLGEPLVTPLRTFLSRLWALVRHRQIDRDIDDEIAGHLGEATDEYIQQGLSPEDAHWAALRSFGGVAQTKEVYRQVRSFVWLDDLARDILNAFRTFRRAPLAALTIVATVALGLGLVAVVFTVYNIFMLRVDAVQSPGELFAVQMEQRIGPNNEPDVVFTRPDYHAMRRETSVFTDAFAMLDHAGPIEGRLARSALVSGNFFQVLGVQATLGRPLLPDDDERGAGRPVIVLSDAGWRKLFQGDRAVIGRRVAINGAPYEVVGVMPDGFRGLGVTPPDYWAPLALAEQFRDDGAGPSDEIAVEVIGRLKPAMSREAAAAALAGWASRRTEFNRLPGHQIHVWLTPRQGTLSTDDIERQLLFVPLFFAFGLILMIGCANVANLLLARGVSRQREIGIRLSLGASRRRIIRQLLTESLLLALAAAACALLVSRLFLEGALHAVITTLPPEIAQPVSLLNPAAPAADWRLLMFLVAGAVVSTAFFGLAPALQSTRFDLVRSMRGEVTRDARPRRARHALIAVQVGASALLLICAAIFLRGAVASATRDPGIRTSDTVKVSIETETRRAEILQVLNTHPLVTIVAASSPSARAVIETSVSGSRMSVDQLAVSSEYFTVLGLGLVSGRGFTEAERSAEAGVVVVSESIARQLGNLSGVGQVVRLEAPPSTSPGATSLSAEARSAKVEPSSRTLTVVGIVRDSGRASGRPNQAYLPTAPETPGTALMLRVRGNPEQARLALRERLTGLDPVFGIMTLQTMTGMQSHILQIAFAVAVVLGGLALVLTVSGLFSVLSYLVEQQAKEIGVRMALGATTGNVAELVLSQSIRPVGIGLAAGGGLAAAVAIVLMATPVAAEIGGVVDVFDPVAYAASLLVIVASCVLAVAVPTLRAASIDPIATLRQD
jgi:predicted permease